MKRLNERTQAGRARDVFVLQHKGNDRLRANWRKILEQLEELGPEPKPDDVRLISQGRVRIKPLVCDECGRQKQELVGFTSEYGFGDMYDNSNLEPEDEAERETVAIALCNECLIEALQLIDE